MWQRFTEHTRRVIFFAQEESARLGQNDVGTEHLLLGLVRERDSAAARILERLGVNPTRVRQETERQLSRRDGRLGDEMQLTPSAKRVIDLAYEEARDFNDNHIGSEHLLLGLLRETEGVAFQVLSRFGIPLERARHEVKTLHDVEMNPPTEVRHGESEYPRKTESVPPYRAIPEMVEAATRAVEIALAEDLTPNDLTSDLTVPESALSTAVAVAKADGVIAGLACVWQAFAQVDPDVVFTPHVEDGARVSVGTEIFIASGASRGILKAERTALNLLQQLSGVATETARYVDAVRDTGAKIVDTRKTTPGLRRLEKYAVRMGGGRNHRTNLSDGILIKDNHIVAAGGISAAVERVGANAPHTLRIEVEVTDEDQIREALNAGADVLLLDNMSPDQLRAAVELIGGRALTEASGGITLETIRAVAEAGVDFISVGALTHSAPALDISLQFRSTL